MTLYEVVDRIIIGLPKGSVTLSIFDIVRTSRIDIRFTPALFCEKRSVVVEYEFDRKPNIITVLDCNLWRAVRDDILSVCSEYIGLDAMECDQDELEFRLTPKLTYF